MMQTRRSRIMQWLVAVLTGACLVVGLMPHQEAIADEVATAGLFEHLDLEREELGAVRSSVGEGDYPAAAEALRLHFVDRETPVFSPVSPATRSALFESTAAEMRSGLFKHSSGDERNFGNLVDWADPWTDTPGELASPFYHMQDFGFIPTLIGEYLSLPVGDPQRAEIVDTWMDLSLQYVDAFPEHGQYNRLGEAKRLTQWLTAFSVFRTDPTIDALELTRFLNYLHGMTDNLWKNVESNSGNNWYISIGRAFYLVAVYLPEFRDARIWELRAEGVADRFIAGHLKGDGLEYEPAINYQHYALSLLLQIEEFGKLNGRSPLGDNAPSVERLAEGLMSAMMPNLHMPLIGDTSNSELSLGQAADVFDRSDMRWVSDGRRSGEAPAFESVLLPQSFAVMRTGWEPNDAYMFINNQDTDYAASHRHPDDLSLVLYAHGRPLLVDPGVSDYNDNPTANWLRRTTEAHNTIEIDGQPQPSTAAGPRERRVTKWLTNTGFDYFSGFHDDYAPTTHERNVFFSKPGVWVVSDRITGEEGQRSLRQLWHGPADAPVSTTEGQAHIGFGDVPGVVIADVDATPVQTYSHGVTADGMGAVQTDVPFVAMEKTADGNTHFDTVLAVGPAGTPVEVATERLLLDVDAAEASAFLYEVDGVGSLFYRSHDQTPELRQVGDMATDAEVMNVVLQDSGSPASIGIVNASAVRDKSKDIIRSASPVSGLWVEWGSSLRIATSTPFDAPIDVFAPGVTNVELNDVPIEFERFGDYVRIPATTSLEGGTAHEPEFQADQNSESWEFLSGGNNFESVSGAWSPVQAPDGTWAMSQGSTSTSDGTLLTAVPFEEGTLSSVFTRKAAARTHGFGHYHAYQDQDNYLLLRVYRLDGVTTAEIIQRAGGESSVLASETINIDAGTETLLSTSVAGGQLRISTNDTEVLSARANVSPVGALGLHAHRIEGTFSSVSFTPPHQVDWDFESGVPDQWESIVGNWDVRRLADGTAAYGQGASALSSGRSIVSGQVLDMEVSATFNPIASRPTMGAGLFVRYHDPDNHHLLRLYRLDGGQITAEILRTTAGSSTVVASETVNIDANQPIVLRAVALGDQLSLELNGVTAVEAIDTSLLDGGYGLHLHRANAAFSEVGIRFSAEEGTNWSFQPPSLDGWQPVNGLWQPVSETGTRGAIQSADTSVLGATAIKVGAPRDVEFTTLLTYGAGARTRGAGVYLRYQDARNAYLLRIYRSNDAYTTDIVRILAGSETVLASESIQIDPATPLDVRAIATGDRLELWLDGDRVVTAEDSAISSGSLGLWAHRSSASFADLKAAALTSDEWRVFRGGVFEGDGHLLLEGARPAGALVTTERSRSWGGVRVEATLANISGNSGAAGLVTRASGTSAGYSFLVSNDSEGPRARIELMNRGSNGTSTPILLAETEIAQFLEPGTRLRAEAFGDRLVMWIDDVEVLRVRNGVLATGGIGLASSFERAEFSAVRVTSLETSAPVTDEWSASLVYGAGDLVSFESGLWRAMWHTSTSPPGDVHGPWQEIGQANKGIPPWTDTRVFLQGDVATFDDKVFKALWWTRNQQPGDPYGPWKSFGIEGVS